MGFHRQKYWSGLPFPSLGDLPDPGFKPRVLHLQMDSLPPNHQGNPHLYVLLSSGKAFYLTNLFCFVSFLTIFGCAGSSLQHPGFSSCSAQAKLSCSTWDLSSLTRDRRHIPCIGRWILNHWTTREVPRAKLYPCPRHGFSSSQSSSVRKRVATKAGGRHLGATRSLPPSRE